MRLAVPPVQINCINDILFIHKHYNAQTCNTIHRYFIYIHTLRNINTQNGYFMILQISYYYKKKKKKKKNSTELSSKIYHYVSSHF
jgi:hypothetical protein